MPGSDTFALIAGGGTAGHILPGLTVAAALVARGHVPDSLVFVGSERAMDRDLVAAAGFPHIALPGRGVQRRPTPENIGAVWGLLRGVWRGVGLVRRRRPAVVVVLGGFASVPCTVGAVLWRVPIIVLEQNARAGAANRLAGRFARACAVPFPETDLPRSVVTGNPVRAEVLAIDRRRDSANARRQLGIPPERVAIAVVTGSLGAGRVNRAVAELVGRWSDRHDLSVRHVVGSRDWSEFSANSDPEISEPHPGTIHVQLIEYEERMDLVLAAADLFVGRAGGTTVAELAEVGMPAVLVPLPIAPRDHQTANGRVLERAGAALLIPDAELDGERLRRELEPLVGDRARLAAMGRAAHALAHPDAAERVADLIEEHARVAR